MKRWMLAAAAAAVIAIAAFLLLRTGAAPAPAAPDPPEGTAARPTTEPAGAARSGPSLPSQTAEGAEPTGDVRTYGDDGGRPVVDHRRNPTPYVPAKAQPEQRSEVLDPLVVTQVHAQVRPIVNACMKDVPQADLGEGALVQVRLTVRIAGGALTVAKVAPTVRALGAHADAVAACVQQRSAALRLATDHPDLSDYDLTFPFRLGR